MALNTGIYLEFNLVQLPGDTYYVFLHRIKCNLRRLTFLRITVALCCYGDSDYSVVYSTICFNATSVSGNLDLFKFLNDYVIAVLLQSYPDRTSVAHNSR